LLEGASHLGLSIGKFSNVRSIDNLSSGALGNLEGGLNRRNLEFVQGDLKDLSVAEKVVAGVEVVLHLAANSEVRVAEVDPSIHFS
jgi:nucleoside-diphosphate-sugar epimerase